MTYPMFGLWEQHHVLTLRWAWTCKNAHTYFARHNMEIEKQIVFENVLYYYENVYLY